MEGVCIYPNVEAGFIRAPEADYIINPEATIKLEKDTHLIVLGNKEQIKKLREIY